MGMAYVAEDDGGNDGIVITHADVALELDVLLSESLCAGVELGLAEGGHGVIADCGGGDTDGGGDCGGQEGIEGVMTERGEHERGLMVVWADVPVGEGVEGVEEGRGGLGRCETSHGEMGALWEGRAGEFERRCGTQGCHGWGWGEKEETGQEERYRCAIFTEPGPTPSRLRFCATCVRSDSNHVGNV